MRFAVQSGGGRMRVLSAITDPTVAGQTLRCLSLPARAPPLAAANEEARVSGQAGAEWLGEVPAFDFDQSPPTGDSERSSRNPESQRLRIDSDPPRDELRLQIDLVAPDGRPREGTTPGKLEVVP